MRGSFNDRSWRGGLSCLGAHGLVLGNTGPGSRLQSVARWRECWGTARSCAVVWRCSGGAYDGGTLLAVLSSPVCHQPFSGREDQRHPRVHVYPTWDVYPPLFCGDGGAVWQRTYPLARRHDGGRSLQPPPLQDTPPLAMRTGAWRDQSAPWRACVSNAGMAVVVGDPHGGPLPEGREKQREFTA